MAARAPKPLDALRTRVRRFQLVVGMGFLSVVIGALLAGKLYLALSALAGAPLVVRLLLNGLISTFWAWLVLPPTAYALARVIDLRPWPTALGAIATGLVFMLGVQVVGGGLESLGEQLGPNLVRLAFTAAGAFLTRVAIQRSRAAALRVEAQAKEKAAANKAQYDTFAQEAQRLAERRESVPIAGENAPKKP